MNDEAEAGAIARTVCSDRGGNGAIDRQIHVGAKGRGAALIRYIQSIAASCRGWRRYWILDEEFAAEARQSEALPALYPNDRRRSFQTMCEDASLAHLQTAAPPAVPQEAVLRQVSEMASLAEEVAGFPRLRAERTALDCERADLLMVLTHSMASARLSEYPARQALTTVFPRVPVWIRTDSRRLERVFENLLVAAAEYNNTDGQVQLSVEVDNGEAVVRIRDTGAGIVADPLPNAFELLVCAERHGGTVQTGSEGTVTGSEFTVRIPMAAA